MTKKISVVAAGFAFAAALALNAGPHGIAVGSAASAQSLNRCVSPTARALGNPKIYLGAKYARTVGKKLKAMRLDRTRIAVAACKAARGNVKKAIALGKNDVSAMLMGLRRPVQIAKKPMKPTGKRLNKKALSAALKKQLAPLQSRCAAVRTESSKIALQAKAIKDIKAQAAAQARLNQAEAIQARCARISRAMTVQAKMLSANKTPDKRSLDSVIKDVESMQEELRNKRQMSSTAFQNFDQKSNQLYNLLSQVVKSMHEMRMSVIKNMK